VNIDEALLGVRPTAPGFEQADVRPPTGGLDHVEGTVPTERGTITASWSRPADGSGPFDLTVVLPANVSATVGIPAIGPDSITDNGQPLRDVEGVQFLGMDGDLALLAVGSGSYAFSSSAVPARYTGRVASGVEGSAGKASGDAASPRTASGVSGSARAGASGVKPAARAKHGAPLWLVVLLLAAQLFLMTFALKAHRRSLASPHA
jgi:hypothetical protein